MAKTSSIIGVLVAIPLLMMMFACGGCLIMVMRVKSQVDAERAAMTPEERAAEDKSRQESMAGIDAQIAAKRAVTSILKAPDTAKFSNIQVGKLGEHSWTVTGNITAVNAFNAPLRKEFLVTLWRPDDADGARDFLTGSIMLSGESSYENAKVNAMIDQDSPKKKPGGTVAPMPSGDDVATVATVTDPKVIRSPTRGYTLRMTITNKSAEPLTKVGVDVSLVDFNGEVLAKDSLVTTMRPLAPGESRLVEIDTPRYSPLAAEVPDTVKAHVIVRQTGSEQYDEPADRRGK